MSFDYKKSGVDVEAGDALVSWLQDDKNKMPFQDKVISGIGGFASLFRFQFPEIKKPLLVSCTDGVGTKVKLASYFEDYSTIGQDLVAMCVNDLICTGGFPLFFLDYYACGKLDLNNAKEFLKGVKKACQESDCALVGGETAEMPGVYQDKDFDCAGFSVGIVDEDSQLGAHRVTENDIIIGVASSGFHSNGYSLLRKVFADDLDIYRQELLKPTALYVRLIKKLLEKTKIHAIAHITGGGMDNLPRVIPSSLSARLDLWTIPEPFLEVQRRCSMDLMTLLRTLNCGVGLCLVIPATEKENVLRIISESGHSGFYLGDLEKRQTNEEWRIARGV